MDHNSPNHRHITDTAFNTEHRKWGLLFMAARRSNTSHTGFSCRVIDLSFYFINDFIDWYKNKIENIRVPGCWQSHLCVVSLHFKNVSTLQSKIHSHGSSWPLQQVLREFLVKPGIQLHRLSTHRRFPDTSHSEFSSQGSPYKLKVRIRLAKDAITRIWIKIFIFYQAKYYNDQIYSSGFKSFCLKVHLNSN